MAVGCSPRPRKANASEGPKALLASDRKRAAMANLNKVMLIGRLTRDPETATRRAGNSVTNFGLAVNRTYRKKDSDEQVEETSSSTSRRGARRRDVRPLHEEGRPGLRRGPP